MRQAGRFPVKRLYILGAGASFSLTKQYGKPEKQAPLDAQMCKRIVGLKDRHKWVKDAQSRIKKDWKDHHDFDKTGLEEAIIKQIGHFDFLNSIHPKKGTRERNINSYIYDLSHLIAVLFSKVEESDRTTTKKFIDIVFRLILKAKK